MKEQTRKAVLSLTVLALCGVALSGWTLYYTDWFPVVGGLLGLGGVFAWLAFLGNLVSDDRKADFQAAFDDKILQNKNATFAVAIAVAALFAGVMPFWGTLEIESLGDEKSRIVEIRAFDASGAYKDHAMERVLLSPRSSTKVRVYTGWFGEARFYVKADGLPGLVVGMPRFGVKSVSVPSGFKNRAVVLARPAFAKLGIVRAKRLHLVATVDGNAFGRIENYLGDPVWLGAEADVEVPPALTARWHAEVLGDKRVPRGTATGINRFESLGPHQRLLPSSKIRIELQDENGSMLYLGELEIPASGARIGYPLELVIDSPVN